MKKIVAIIMILGFAAVDFLFFHDLFKPGEITNIAQILTGFLSIPVFVVAVQSLLKTKNQG